MSATRTVTLSRTVPFPVEDVAAWMARPGAATRLLPPWLPLSFRSEATSLRDGSAVLALPGGLTVTSHHDPDSYIEGRRFADTVTLPAATRLPGAARRVVDRLPFTVPERAEVVHHVHLYEPAGENATTLTDSLTAPAARLTAGRLEEAASYRARQISGDLEYAQRLRALPGTDAERALTIGMTGASGTIGTQLAAALTTSGHRVVRLVRGAAQGPDERHWDPANPAADIAAGLDVLVHLAGAPIAGRFTDKHKAKIRDSRLGPTAALARVAGDAAFVSASAIGYYGADRGEEVLPEDAAPGSDFLAEVVRGWEAEAAQAPGRSVMVRTGIVQSADGGALGLQHPLYAAGLGGRLGSGEQWLAWIALEDLLDVYLRAIVDPAVSGPVNAVAPHPVRQREWAATMGRVLRRPTVLPTPMAGPRALLGTEGAEALALASQRVDAVALRRLGHTYRFPVLGPALGHELGHSEQTVVRRA